ncbi:MAG TPA: hypothetical protein VFR02_06620 [bacterium]|nr:hypothetical protein [bacterium]
MSRPVLALVLFAVGILGLCFALGRTYYLVWKLRKGREPVRKRPDPPGDAP